MGSSYREPQFLKDQIKAILGFYLPIAIDRDGGGYFQGVRDDGTIYDAKTKHLVGTCRHIYNFSVAYELFAQDEYREAAEHGLRFLAERHRQADGGYAWVMEGAEVADATRHAYGHAFVLLAAATAAKAGIGGARELVEEVFELLERHFWSAEDRLYADVIAADGWEQVDPYRGQNANMHLCEALLAAHAATGEASYLERAALLARRICVDLAGQSEGLVWEHYASDWSVDWDYNKDDPKNLFRPYGYLPGHFVEWAKLLVLLHRERSEQWMLEKAKELFAAAIDRAWDDKKGGFSYTFGPDGTILDTDRYYWVLAEAIAAAALLGGETGDPSYWKWYDCFWEYSLRVLIDTERGGWYRLVDSEGNRYDDQKSPPAKSDYHPLSACYVAVQEIDG